MPASRPFEERFWEKVDRRGPNECWPWLASTREGYGRIGGSCPIRKVLDAHRVSWEIHNGPIPVGEGYHGTCVLHSCDNPSCVNPAHLFLGTNLDNIKDKVEKGRQSFQRGEKHGNAKLTEEEVAEIRRDYVKGSRAHSFRALARKYGVGKTAIEKIVNGVRWK